MTGIAKLLASIGVVCSFVKSVFVELHNFVKNRGLYGRILPV